MFTLNKDDIKKIEKEEAELAEGRAIARKKGELDASNSPRIFKNLIDKGVWINPREERLRKAKDCDETESRNVSASKQE